MTSAQSKTTPLSVTIELGKHRHKILNRLSQINVILSRNELVTFDDNQHIDEADLRLIVQLALIPGSIKIVSE